MRSCIASLLFGKVLSILLANWYIKVCSLSYLSLPSQAEVNTALPLPSIPSPMCHSEPGASWSHTETPQEGVPWAAFCQILLGPSVASPSPVVHHCTPRSVVCLKPLESGPVNEEVSPRNDNGRSWVDCLAARSLATRNHIQEFWWFEMPSSAVRLSLMESFCWA